MTGGLADNTQPWFAEHDVTLWQGHVLDVLPTLAAGSVNCVVTSPPYYGLRDYGVAGQIGLEASPTEYVETLRKVFAEVRRVLRADGVLWVNIGDSYASSPPGKSDIGMRRSTLNGKGAAATLRESVRSAAVDRSKFLPEKNMLGIPWRVAFALQDDGWTLRNAVIWSKPNAMPESVTDRLSTRYEHVFLFTRSRRYWFDLDPIREQAGDYSGSTWADRKAAGEPNRYGLGGLKSVGATVLAANEKGRNPGDVWTIATQPYAAAHFATFPPDLARRCILAGCPQDGTVLDPFTGSGTTLMVARQLMRKSVGVELNPDYCQLAVDRIGQPVFDFGEVV